MLIRYDWQKIRRYAKGNANRVIKVIAYQTFKHIPESQYDPMYQVAYSNWSGPSFLAYPDRLLSYRRIYTPRQIAEYIGIASYRSYTNYKLTKQVHLSLLECPIPMEKMANNPLLRVVDDSIQFLHEA